MPALPETLMPYADSRQFVMVLKERQNCDVLLESMRPPSCRWSG